MKILFDVRDVGLGNNGGSRTIVRSANALKKLGVEIIVLDSMPSEYTWDKLNIKHLIIKSDKDLPGADFIIATGFNSVQKTLDAPNICGKKIWYIRGWETWNTNEEKLIRTIQNQDIVKIVNGRCLQDKLLKFEVRSEVIRPGYDFDEFYFTNSRVNNSKLTLGGILNFGRKRNSKRSEWILNVYNNLIKNGIDVDIKLYGCERNPIGFGGKYIANPTIEQKNKIYNSVDFWLSPTELEGLHNVAAEAMLTKCIIIGTSAEMNGMKDYLVHNVTGIESLNKFDCFYETIKYYIQNYNKEFCALLGDNARKAILSFGSREDNMRKLIEYLSEV